MNATLQALIDALARMPEALVRLTVPLAEDALDFHAHPDEWSIREVLAHLVDDEMYVMRTRLERIIKEDQPYLAPHDETRWFATRNRSRDQLNELLEDFAVQRAASLGIMRLLRAPDWERKGYQPEYGAFTAAQWLTRWAEHDAMHLRQIERALQTFRDHEQMRSVDA